MRVVCNANESFNALKMEGRGSKKVWLHIVMHILLKWKWKPLEMPSVTCMKSDAKKRISRENLKCFTLLPMSSVKGYFRWLRYDIAIFLYFLLNFQHKKLLRNFEGPQKGSKLFLLRWNYLIWYQEMLLMTAIKHFSIDDRENGRCASRSLTRSSMSMAA